MFDDGAWLGDSVAGPAGAGHDQAAAYRQVGLALLYVYMFIYSLRYLVLYIWMFDDGAWLGDSVAGPAGAGHDQAAAYRQVWRALPYVSIYLFTEVF